MTNYVSPLHPGDADATQLLSRVASRRRRRCEHNSQLAHDDCRRIRSTIWKLNITNRKLVHDCRLMCSRRRRDATQLDSSVASASIAGVYWAKRTVSFNKVARWCSG